MDIEENIRKGRHVVANVKRYERRNDWGCRKRPRTRCRLIKFIRTRRDELQSLS